MKLHRFYVGNSIELTQKVWVRDTELVHQWGRVLRYRIGDELVLFDGVRHDRLYKLLSLDKTQAHLELVTQLERVVPTRDVYLAWSLLKKDKNNWVLQKATELGVNHFVPIIADRSEKTGFNVERAKKIITEAAEQCGRSTIPNVREPVRIESLHSELASSAQWLVAEKGSPTPADAIEQDKAVCVLIGPEGGWTDDEKAFFNDQNVSYFHLGQFTLRAETAAVAAAAKLA